MQMEVTECGAAALGIILGYHKRFIPLEMLREDCGVSRDGSKAVNLLKAARMHHMHAQAAKVENLEALKKIAPPFIVYWGFDHFVVIEGIKGNRYYLNDPATGPRIADLKEFDQMFTGLVLIMTPEKDFSTHGKPPSLLAPLLERLSGSVSALLYILLCTLALTLPGLLIAGCAKIFIDYILIQQTKSWLIPLLTGLILTALIQGLLTWLQQRYLLRVFLKMKLAQTANFFWHILHLPIAYFQQRYTGDIYERIESNDRVADLLAGEVTTSLVSLFSMLLYAVVLVAVNWQLAALVILVTGLNAVFFLLISRKIADSSRLFLQQSGSLAGLEVNGLRHIETIKASAIEQVFFSRWAGQHAKTINSQQQIQKYNTVLELLPEFLNGLSTVIVLGLGSLYILQGEFTIGALVAFQSLSSSFQEPLNSLLNLGEETQQIKADLMRLEDGLNYQTDPSFEIADDGRNSAQFTRLSLHNITFGYSKLDEPLLQDFNLELLSGQHIALIGATGSGKSTLAKLICRFYQPWSGTIAVDQHDLQTISTRNLSRSIAFVDQGIFLFAGTVRDNLSLWDENISATAMHQALRDACLEQTITHRGGLESRITEGGSNFSGGECQRLEIARALCTNPSIIIFDEATSSLDAIIEKQIYENIKRRNCTLFIIAHRLSAIKDCDEIIVLDQGRIIERGTHQQLMNTQGAYQKLISWEA